MVGMPALQSAKLCTWPDNVLNSGSTSHLCGLRLFKCVLGFCIHLCQEDLGGQGFANFFSAL